MSIIRSQIDTRAYPVGGAGESDARWVRKEERPKLEDFVGLVHSVLKQAMRNTENSKQPISVSNLQDVGVSKEMDQELQHFLISRSEGEALEVVRGAAREPGLEQWQDLCSV